MFSNKSNIFRRKLPEIFFCQACLDLIRPAELIEKHNIMQNKIFHTPLNLVLQYLVLFWFETDVVQYRKAVS